MTKETLTPWDAPFEPERRRPEDPSASLRTLLGQSGSALGAAGIGTNIARPRSLDLSIAKPEEPEPKWYQFRKKYKDKSLLQTPLIYLWFLALISFNIFMMFSDGHLDAGDIVRGGSVGFIGGVMLFTWMQRRSQSFDEKLRKMERDLERDQMRFEIACAQREARTMVDEARREAQEYVRRALNQR